MHERGSTFLFFIPLFAVIFFFTPAFKLRAIYTERVRNIGWICIPSDTADLWLPRGLTGGYVVPAYIQIRHSVR